MYKNYPYFDKPIKVVAHRGDSRFFPENSFEAFQSAIDLGVDIIETDVHISSDGVVFIWHDDTTERLDGDTRDVSKRSWAELKELDLGFIYIDKDGRRPFASKGIKLMTLEDTLKIFPTVRFTIDLKDKESKLVDNFLNIITNQNAFDRVITGSFHNENMKRLRAKTDKIATSYSHREVFVRVLLEQLGMFRFFSNFMKRHPVMQVPVVSGSTRVVTRRFIKILHKRGIKIQVWTINNREEMEHLFKMGVDGIMTDDPRLLLDVLNR